MVIPEALESALLRLADELDVSLSSIFLAAHAKTLAALSGELEVTTGYLATKVGRALPCRITTEPKSWRALLSDVHRIVSELLWHKLFPVEDLKQELSVTGPLFETAFDPSGIHNLTEGGIHNLTEDDVMVVSVSQNDGRTALRLIYRTDVLDADSAARIRRLPFRRT